MTFTGKSSVLNSKTQKYMFWIQKNKHLFSSYNVILKIHKEQYPFVNSKSKAACVLHEEDCGYRVTPANNWAGRKQRDAYVVPPASPLCQPLELHSRSVSFCLLVWTGCWNHSVDRRFLFSGAYCKSDLIVWVGKFATVQIVAILEVPRFNSVNFCYTFASPPLPPDERGNVWKNQVMQFCNHQEMWGFVW